jgi:hypothetical protein
MARCSPVLSRGLFDFVDHDGPATGLQARIASTDSIDTIAAVRVEEDNWTGHRFTTLFTPALWDRRASR